MATCHCFLNGKKKPVLAAEDRVHHTKTLIKSLYIVLIGIEPLRMSTNHCNINSKNKWHVTIIHHFMTKLKGVLLSYKLLSLAIFCGIIFVFSISTIVHSHY